MLVDTSRSASHEILRPLKNPIVIATAIGVTLSVTGWTLPSVVFEPLTILSDAAVGLALVFFGVSLSSTRFLEAGTVSRREAAGLAAAKSVLHPAVAIGIAVALGLDSPSVVAAGIMGALPTAQNVFIYSSQYGTAPHLARDVSVITTLAALPTMLVISLLLM